VKWHWQRPSTGAVIASKSFPSGSEKPLRGRNDWSALDGSLARMGLKDNPILYYVLIRCPCDRRRKCCSPKVSRAGKGRQGTRGRVANFNGTRCAASRYLARQAFRSPPIRSIQACLRRAARQTKCVLEACRDSSAWSRSRYVLLRRPPHAAVDRMARKTC